MTLPINIAETLAEAKEFLALLELLRAEDAARELHEKRRHVPDWMLLRRVAARAQPSFQKNWTKAVAKALNGTVAKDIESRLKVGDIDGAVEAVPWMAAAEPVIRGDLMRTFVDTYSAAGNTAVKVFPTKTRFPFAVDDDRPLEWIRAHGAERVTQFGVQNREGLHDALTSMMQDGLTPQQAAKLIRQHVGLSRPFARAVENERKRLAKAEDPKLEQKVARYAHELHVARSKSIARTEAQFAVHGGRAEAWAQAVDRGIIDPDKARRRVRTAGDDVVRDDHEAMEGQVRRLDEPFNRGDGTEVDDAPFDVNCRCSVELLMDGE